MPLGILLLIFLSICQALGLCHQGEQAILRHLPSGWLPTPPPVVLITLDQSSQGFQAMDVAMALRGLGKFHPRCIVINGSIAPEVSPVPFLPDIIAQLQAMPSLELIRPEAPSSKARFQSVSLIRYSPSAELPKWPKIEGLATPESGKAYLPATGANDGSISLFATTAQGVPVGSLWWWSLPEANRKSPPLLLFNKFLFSSSHSLIPITLSGAFNPSLPGKLIEIPLDDFLLKLERKEQGSISPSFDTLWDKSTVILGASAGLSQESAFASLLQESAFCYFPLRIQALMAIGWVLLFLASLKQNLLHRKIISFLLLLIGLSGMLLFLMHGIIFPLLPCLGISALLFSGLNKR